MTNNTNKFLQEHASYTEENKKNNKKIVYGYSFNWIGFTYNGLKSEYSFDVDIKFNTFDFEADRMEGVTQYLSVRIDLQKEKLIIEIDNNPLFKSVEAIIFYIDDTISPTFKKLNIDEGEMLIKEYCRQAKANELSYIELTGSPVAFSYED
ncbi:hypothetical protein [Lysinibacillus sphaericus]|uniref:hypothetical protein n=1 Tax=Lysinibacillus sphaericus TaxID=1421 RepID=UPI0018CCE9A8|nr:hypothetical protein [Lysinibacillus sphaericus]